MQNRIIALMIVLCLVVGLVPAVSASEVVDSGENSMGIVWTLDADGCLTLSGEGPLAGGPEAHQPWHDFKESIVTLVIKDGITEISANSFKECINLVSVSMADSVELIGQYAFLDCSSLEVVELSANITTIAAWAFCDCANLKGPIVIPQNVSYMAARVFESCSSLQKVILPEGLTAIHDVAFWHSGITEITIPASVERVYAGAFQECTNLGKVVFEGDAPVFGGGVQVPTLSNPVFGNVNATVYYPADNPTWTEEVMQQYGGTLIWVPYSAEEPSEPEPTEPEPTEPEPTEPEPTEPEPTDPTEPEEDPFVDVAESAYYYEPVLWAVENGITGGTSATTFGPEEACTRGQIVTFLWAAAGRPEPASANNPFTDVKADAYYYKAVLWAVENGITGGTSATTFGPEEACTRAQVVTFLWAAQNRPEPVSGQIAFSDVKENDYYAKAVLWAVENGITSGVGGGKFGSGATCTRGQIVTFLYGVYA